MSFFSIVDSPAFGRSIDRAGRRADSRFVGSVRPKPGRLVVAEPTPEQRAAGLARVRAMFGGRVPVLGPDESAPRL